MFLSLKSVASVAIMIITSTQLQASTAPYQVPLLFCNTQQRMSADAVARKTAGIIESVNITTADGRMHTFPIAGDKGERSLTLQSGETAFRLLPLDCKPVKISVKMLHNNTQGKKVSFVGVYTCESTDVQIVVTLRKIADSDKRPMIISGFPAVAVGALMAFLKPAIPDVVGAGAGSLARDVCDACVDTTDLETSETVAVASRAIEELVAAAPLDGVAASRRSPPVDLATDDTGMYDDFTAVSARDAADNHERSDVMHEPVQAPAPTTKGWFGGWW